MAKLNKRKKRKNSRDDSLSALPGVVLLQKRQWRHLTKRYRMTERELDIAKLVCRGFSNDEIAHVLNIRLGTVKTHIRNIYRKTSVRNKITMLLKFVEDANRVSPITVKHSAS